MIRNDPQRDEPHADYSLRCISNATPAWIQIRVIRFLWKKPSA
jgi:hypothetical protein